MLRILANGYTPSADGRLRRELWTRRLSVAASASFRASYEPWRRSVPIDRAEHLTRLLSESGYRIDHLAERGKSDCGGYDHAAYRVGVSERRQQLERANHENRVVVFAELDGITLEQS